MHSKLESAVGTIRTILHGRDDHNNGSQGSEDLPGQCSAWQDLCATIQTKQHRILGANNPNAKTLAMKVFCLNEGSVQDLWEALNKGKPAAIALNVALQQQGISYETCEIVIKSETQGEVVGSVVLSSEQYDRLVAEVIAHRKKQQDIKWTTLHGAAKDKQIAKEMEVQSSFSTAWLRFSSS